MKYIKLGIDLFLKNPKMNLFLVVQLIVSILAVNFCLGTTQSIKVELDLIEKIPNKNTVCFMPTFEMSNLKGNNYLDLKDIKEKFSIGETGYFFVNYKKAEGIKAFVYSQALLKNLKVPLSKGTWDFKVLNKNGIVYYPIVINTEYKNLKYQDSFQVSSEEFGQFGVYVAGVLHRSQRYVSMSTSGNTATSDLFFKRNLGENQLPLFFLNDSIIPQKVRKSITYQGTKFLFFDDDIKQNALDKEIKKLSNQGYVYSLESIVNNSYKNYNEYMRFYWPFCAFIFLISLVGIISFSALNTLRNTKYFSILYLCGCPWKNCKYICVSNLGFCSFIALIIAILIYNFVNLTGALVNMNLYFTHTNIVMTVLLIAITIIVPMLIPYYMIKKLSVNEFIKKFDK